MDRRRFLLTSLAGAVAAPLAAGAQQGRVARVGILSASSPSVIAAEPAVRAFEDGLKDLGWTVGRDLILEWRYAEGQRDRLAVLARDLVRLEVDVIVCFGPNSIGPAREATRTVPLVMIGVVDPVGDGLVASLARPGGNVTGVTHGAGVETFGKILGFVREVLPRASRVTILSDGPFSVGGALAFADGARKLDLRVEISDVKDLTEVESAISAISRQGVDAVYLPMRSFIFSHRTRVAALALARRLPTFSGLRDLPEAGGLLSYGQPLTELYRRAATFVDQILKGAKPADLPVQQAMKFELVINLKTAKALGLTIPPSVLARADQIIE